MNTSLGTTLQCIERPAFPEPQRPRWLEGLIGSMAFLCLLAFCLGTWTAIICWVFS